jgi:hypothetical protein
MSINFSGHTDTMLETEKQMSKNRIAELYQTKKEMELTRQQINGILNHVRFTLRVDFQPVLTSIDSFVGTYTMEVMDIEAEQEKRKAKKDRQPE